MKADNQAGFTLTEVMFASAITLLLFLVLFETLSVCQRLAANVKWRLAADALAYDVAWETFNKQTAWFDTRVTAAQAEWREVPKERTSVWYADGKAYYFRSITPSGVPASNWVIRTNVQWPLPGKGNARLARDYEVVRFRADRNLFRAAQ
jgi:prepilin-type N-terminal cleavage/methylation domain-containing protein